MKKIRKEREKGKITEVRRMKQKVRKIMEKIK